MTPRALTSRALKKSGVVGVGQTPNATDLADALDDLNDMFGQWQRRRWLVTDLIEVVFGPTGAASYSIGPAITNDVIMARPDRIQSAFLRFNPRGANPADYPLDILPSREDYNEIVLKNWKGPPSSVFYDAAFPTGTIYLWPVPLGTGTTEVHLFFKNTEFLTLGLDDNINLPPEYGEALLYNLAARLRPSYQLPPDGSVVALAASSLATIRNANAQIPLSKMPPGLPGRIHGSMGVPGAFTSTGSAGGTGTPGAFLLDISPLDGKDVIQ